MRQESRSALRPTRPPIARPRIPYGWADFRASRLENRLYVNVHGWELVAYQAVDDDTGD